jgi:hypothetical protein
MRLPLCSGRTYFDVTQTGLFISGHSTANCPNRPSQNEYRKRVPVHLHQISARQVYPKLILAAAVSIARCEMSWFPPAGKSGASAFAVVWLRQIYFIPTYLYSVGREMRRVLQMSATDRLLSACIFWAV